MQHNLHSNKSALNSICILFF